MLMAQNVFMIFLNDRSCLGNRQTRYFHPMFLTCIIYSKMAATMPNLDHVVYCVHCCASPVPKWSQDNFTDFPMLADPLLVTNSCSGSFFFDDPNATNQHRFNSMKEQ